MARQLQFGSVAHSFDGERLASELSQVCAPDSIYVQTTPDGSAVTVLVPDNCLDDAEIGNIVAAHANHTLAAYRQEQHEAARSKARTREQLGVLLNLRQQWRHGRSYEGNDRDRLLDLVVDILKDTGG